MNKLNNIENLTDEELEAKLEEKSKEDLRADGYDETVIENNTAILGETVLDTNKNYKKQEKKQSAKERYEAKLRQKKIKKSKKYLKKHKVNVVRYDTDIDNGLPFDVVNQRELDGLTNTSIKKTSKSVGKIIFTNIFTFFNMLILLIAATLITVGIMFHNYYTFTDLTFFFIVIVNTIIGIIQEINAKNIIDKLSLMSAPTANVIRDGVKREISVEDVVLDDLIVLTNGDQICSDSIVVKGAIEVNESLLTGESNSILKNPGDPLYAGSFVVAGSCNARVDKIGADNYIEKLSSQAKQYKKPKSDLLGSLNLLIKAMFIPIIALGFLLFIVMYYKSNLDIVTCIRKTAGAMIGMIPSGLFLMSSIAVTIGVIRLGQKNVLVQELYCIEMLARVNCICLDKTGTITDGTMSVKAVVDYEAYPNLATKNIVSAILNAMPSRNQTSDALIEKFGLGKRLEAKEIIPFSSERKFSAVTFKGYSTFLMGAPEYVLNEKFKTYEKDVNKYSSLGYRTIAIASVDGEIVDGKMPDGDVKLIALILITDNIRPDAINTIRYFKESEVEVRVISGDNPLTVSKIASRAGVPNADKYISLEGLTDDEVRKIALRYNVFGRVTPGQKKVLVESLKASGKTVAMTGDGVNDILALREADCSIAVASGSEAARNCSHLVLIDSNFDSMPFVVSEGRRVINNVTKVSTLFLTKTIFSLFLAIMGIIIGYYPISPSQLFMIDTLCIGLPSLLLVWEPNNTPVKGRFLINVIKKALPGALTILLISLIVVSLSVSLGMDNMVRTTLIVLAATHTCLMVELKEFKPFTVARRIMFFACYGLFLFAIIFLPQIFEFKPLASFSEYYSSSVTNQRLVKTPKIDVSEDNYIVFNSKYLSELDYNNINLSNVTNLEVSASKRDNVYYYTISGIQTTETVVVPDLSFDSKGELYLGGYEISNVSASNLDVSSLKISNEGYVYYTNSRNKNINLEITLQYDNDYYDYYNKYGQVNTADSTRTYSVMPTVEIENGEYKINGVKPSDGRYLVSNKLIKDFSNIVTRIEYDDVDNYYYLTVNGEKILKTYNDSTKIQTPYVIDLPTVTISNNNTIYLEGKETGISIYKFIGEEVSYNLDLYDSNGDLITVSYEGYKTHEKVLDKDIIYFPSLKLFYEIDSDENLHDIEYEIANYLDGGIEASFSEELSYFQTKVRNGITLENSSNTVTNYSIYYNNLETNAQKIYSTSVAFAGNIFSPKVEKSVKDKYVIDGYYTSYDYTPSTTYTISLADSNYLVINGTITDYQISSNYITTSTGGLVHILGLQYFILLLMLCFMAPYAIKLFQYIIPSIIQLLSSIKKLINNTNSLKKDDNKKE